MKFTKQQLIDRLKAIEDQLVDIDNMPGDRLADYERLLDEMDACRELLARFDPPAARKADIDDGWRREQAMQAGMGMGVEAYNDYMGY